MVRVIMMGHLIHHRAQLGLYYRLLGIAELHDQRTSRKTAVRA